MLMLLMVVVMLRVSEVQTIRYVYIIGTLMRITLSSLSCIMHYQRNIISTTDDSDKLCSKFAR